MQEFVRYTIFYRVFNCDHLKTVPVVIYNEFTFTQQNSLIMWFLYKQKQNGVQGRWLNRIDEIFESTYYVYSVAYHTHNVSIRVHL